MTYMPQDFRGTLIRQQKERSERNKQAIVDAWFNSGASIRARYALLWEQQMERRRQLAQLGSATGVYKTLVKYLVGVPQVLLDFVRTINDDDGPMKEQRKRYGPPLYHLTAMILSIRLFLSLLWGRYEASKLSYKNGFVWHELSDDDLVLPAHGNEYVLKGSELLDESNSGKKMEKETRMPSAAIN